MKESKIVKSAAPKKPLLDHLLVGGKRIGDAMLDEAKASGEARLRIAGELQKYGLAIEQGKETVVKTTIRLPKSLWRKARLFAIQDDCDFQDVVEAALIHYVGGLEDQEGSR